MAVKLYEIAKATGVSISTVSRILNNDRTKPASKETAQRVLKAAVELGYYTRVPGEGLYAERSEAPSRTLSCVLASASDTFNDNFFSQLLLGIQQEANVRGYSIHHTLSASMTSAESICAQLDSIHTDGVILMGRVRRNIMEYLKRYTKNLIYVGLNRLNQGIDEVICDAYTAIQNATKHLIQEGYRNIGFIGTIPDSQTDVLNEHRYRAYSDTMKLNSLEVNPAYCKSISLGTEQGYNAMLALIKENAVAEAIVCGNDNVAVGAISALRDNGLAIPKDVAIVGMDDIEVSKYIHPTLTTSNMQNVELGRFAVKVLDDRISGQHTVPVLTLLPSTFIVRDSTRRTRVDESGEGR